MREQDGGRGGGDQEFGVGHVNLRHLADIQEERQKFKAEVQGDHVGREEKGSEQ